MDKKLTDNLSNNSPNLSNSLSDSEIVKALECFVNEECPDCERCSYYDYCRKNRVYIDVFDLINRYRVMRDRALKAEAENERLRVVKKHIDILIHRGIEYPTAESYNEAFQKALEKLYDNTNAKAEAYKECVEKVKEYVFRADSHEDGFEHDVVDIDDVYNLLKELVGAERTGTFPTINNELGEDDE